MVNIFSWKNISLHISNLILFLGTKSHLPFSWTWTRKMSYQSNTSCPHWRSGELPWEYMSAVGTWTRYATVKAPAVLLVSSSLRGHYWRCGPNKKSLGRKSGSWWRVTKIMCCKDQPYFNYEHIFFTRSGPDYITDFLIIKLCNQMIMTVGSFGWWVAWLGPRLNGVTVIYQSDAFDITNVLWEITWC